MTAKKRANPRLLLITHDDRKGVALVRGSRAGDLVRLVDDGKARWSESGRGWVITKASAVNLAAYAEYAGLLVIHTRPRTDGAAT